MTDTLLLLGTTKGAFVARSTDDRRSFELSGPHLRGEATYIASLDQRGANHRIFAGGDSFRWGPTLRASDDFGETWSEPAERPIAFPEDAGASVARVWQIVPGAEPDVIFAGVEPAALFRSDDGGATFELVRGLWDHPHRAEWQPGGGGLCLHTILIDPRDSQRMSIAVSAAGHYRTEDGGEKWEARSKGISGPFMPDPDAEFGQCVHKMARDAGNPDRLYLQHHWGVYRSDDSGDTWLDVGKDKLPSDFGFPIVAHPSKPNTAYVIPLDSDEYRATAEGRCRVYRTTDAGDTWEPLGNGLPQDGAHLAILRDGFTSDGMDPLGLWFGTRTGQLYGSADEGESWRLFFDHLPPVLSVRAAQLA